MPPRCKAPKCAEVAGKCACPNPWTEFLSKNAHAGKTSMKEHAAAYRALKATGAFEPKRGMNNAPCKSDAVKLCAWKLRRKAGHKDLQAPAVALLKRRNERNDRAITHGFKAASEKDKIYGVARVIQRLFEPGTPEANASESASADERTGLNAIERKLKMQDQGIKLKTFLGDGYSGVVFSGLHVGKKVAVKVTFPEGDDIDAEKWIASEVYAQRKAFKRMPSRVPELFKAYKVGYDIMDDGHLEKYYVYVLVMELVEFELQRVLKTRHADERFMRHFARQYKALVLDMQKAKIVHQDFHFENVGYKMVSGVPKLYLLDYEVVIFPDDPMDFNIGEAWQNARVNMRTASYANSLRAAMVATNFPEMRGYLESLGGAKPTDATRLEWARKANAGYGPMLETYANKTLRLPKIPEK
jgi:hypothetical protein